MEAGSEGIFHVVADAIVHTTQPAIFKQGAVAAPTSSQILAHDGIVDIPFHVEETMTKSMLANVTAQHKAVDSRLSATLESLIELTSRRWCAHQKQLPKSWRSSSIALN